MSTPVLQYSALPPNSRITATTTPEGVTISIPPAPLWEAILTAAFVSLMLLPITCGMLLSLLHWRDNYSGRDIYFVCAITITLLIFWCALVLTIWKIIQRRNVPTILNLMASQLTIVTPDRPKLRHDFQLNDTLRIQPLRVGIGINLRATGALRVKQNGPPLKILSGRDFREIQWIAHTLTTAIGPMNR